MTVAYRLTGVAGILIAFLIITACGSAWQVPSDTTDLYVTDTVIHRDLPRYGLNLGGSGSWGAEQLRANVLANPGFEAILDRTLIVQETAGFELMIHDLSGIEPFCIKNSSLGVRSCHEFQP